MPEVKKWTCG